MSDQAMPRFEYISCLGYGSFGIVMKSRNTDKDSFSAIKIIFPEGKQDIINFKRECEMKGKSHQNVVKVFNFFETVFTNVSEFEKIEKILGDDDDYQKIRDQLEAYMGRIRRNRNIPAVILQMELCGPTLGDWLKQHVNHNKEDLTFQSTQLEIVKDMINGIQFLHENKIIHRDFKPDNVMFSLSQEGNTFLFPIKIGDFGLCRILHSDESRSKSLTSRLGTLDYMAPEMDGHTYDFQSDIFSLGLVIWEVVQIIPSNGRKKLFTDLVTFDKIELIRNKMPIFTSMIINMTKKDLESRTKTIKEVKDILGEISFTHFKSKLNELSVDFQKVKLNESKDKASPVEFIPLPRVCNWNVNEIVKILVKDESLINGKRRFARSLYISEHRLKELEENYRKTNDIHSYFRDVLEAWKSANGNEATFFTLLNVLKENVFIASADRLSKLLIGNSASVTKLQINDPVSNFVSPEKGLKEFNELFMAKKSSSAIGGKGKKTLLEILENTDTYKLTKNEIIQLIQIWKNALPELEIIKKVSYFAVEIGNRLYNLSLYREMKEFNEITLIQFVKVLGPDHIDTLRMQYQLGIALENNGEYKEALAKLQELWEKEKKVLGEEHEETLNCAGEIAIVLWRLNRLDESLEWHERVLKSQVKVHGENHQNTITTKNNMALVLIKQNKCEEALSIYKQVLECNKKELGHEDPTTLIRQNMAICLYEQGKFVEAKKECENVLELRVKVLGEEHADTLRIKYWLSLTLYSLGQKVKALEMLEQVLISQEKVLGQNHPITNMSRDWISRWKT